MQQTQLIIVKGKVHCVYFRQSTVDVASQLNLAGTVRNVKDGSVEIIATGSAESLQRLVDWCHRGPSRARVEEVIVQPLPLRDDSSFVIRR